MKNPLLSLCIPTNGALNFLIPVLESIYMQGCDESLFEVVVSDNAKNLELQKYIENYGRGNLHYFQSNAPGFLNIVSSFQSAKGDYCKLINHRATLRQGGLWLLINMVRNYQKSQPVIYCTNGALDEKVDIICDNLDELVWHLHYYCTWMAGIGIWRKDIENLKEVEYNDLFPNTSILFEQRQRPSQYLLCNFVYFDQLDGRGKGCYNLFHTFAVVFPNMLEDLLKRGKIKEKTFEKVKKDLYTCLCGFYRDFVLVNPDTSFDLTGIYKSMSVYYPWYKYYEMVWSCKKELFIKSFRDWGHAKKLFFKNKLGIQ